MCRDGLRGPVVRVVSGVYAPRPHRCGLTLLRRDGEGHAHRPVSGCRTGAGARDVGGGNWQLLPFDAKTSTGELRERALFPFIFAAVQRRFWMTIKSGAGSGRGEAPASLPRDVPERQPLRPPRRGSLPEDLLRDRKSVV